MVEGGIPALAAHPYGNYAVQVLLRNVSQPQREQLFELLWPHFLPLAISKHGSNVAEKLVALATPCVNALPRACPHVCPRLPTRRPRLPVRAPLGAVGCPVRLARTTTLLSNPNLAVPTWRSCARRTSASRPSRRRRSARCSSTPTAITFSRCSWRALSPTRRGTPRRPRSRPCVPRRNRPTLGEASWRA